MMKKAVLADEQFQSTEAFAREIGIKPASVRKRYNQTGTYFGIRPRKLPNGRLRWPVDAAKLLLEPVGD